MFGNFFLPCYQNGLAFCPKLTVTSRASHHSGFSRRPLCVDLQISSTGFAGQACLPVCSKSRSADVGLAASRAGKGALVVVESVVQLEVDELGEAGLALVALVRLGARVKSQVGLQV